MKLVEVLCVRAQHAGTQIPTPLRSGAVQAAGKRHARQCHAPGLVKPVTELEVGRGVVGGWFTYTVLGKPGVWWARKGGRAEEKGDFFWHSLCSSIFRAWKGVSQGGCRLTHAFPWAVQEPGQRWFVSKLGHKGRQG